MSALRLLLLVSFLALPSWALPTHDELSEQIAALDVLIEGDSTRADLYVARGELNRQHKDWDAALRDAREAAQLEHGEPAATLLRARVFRDLGWWKTARWEAQLYLEARPKSVDGLLLMATVVELGGNPAGAVPFHDRAIESATPPLPDQYLARATLLRSLGPARRAEALAGLDAGIALLGPLVTLQLAAIDLELESGRLDPALGRLDAIAAQSQRKEKWLARRAEILESADRRIEALATYREALDAIARLKPRHRQTDHVRQLHAQVEARIRALTKVR